MMRALYSIFLLFATHCTCADIIAYDLTIDGDLRLVNYDNDYQQGFSDPTDVFAILPTEPTADSNKTFLEELYFYDDDGKLLPLSEGGSDFFAVSDTKNSDTNNLSTPVYAVWQFDISNVLLRELTLDLAAFGDFEQSDAISMSYWVDDQAPQQLFTSLLDPVNEENLTIEQQLIDEVFKSFSFAVNGEGQLLSLEFGALLNGPEYLAFNNLTVTGDAIEVSEPKLVYLFFPLLVATLLNVRNRRRQFNWTTPQTASSTQSVL